MAQNNVIAQGVSLKAGSGKAKFAQDIMTLRDWTAACMKMPEVQGKLPLKITQDELKTALVNVEKKRYYGTVIQSPDLVQDLINFFNVMSAVDQLKAENAVPNVKSAKKEYDTDNILRIMEGYRENKINAQGESPGTAMKEVKALLLKQDGVKNITGLKSFSENLGVGFFPEKDFPPTAVVSQQSKESVKSPSQANQESKAQTTKRDKNPEWHGSEITALLNQFAVIDNSIASMITNNKSSCLSVVIL